MAYFKYNNKNVFYQEFNEGEPLIFLHGDTASSKMFEFILELYSDFKIITIDFLGNGLSERIEEFPVEMWFDEALQVTKLIEHLGYEKVNLLGTSGGAYVALNVALERPDLINKVIADSFDGLSFRDDFVEYLLKDRNFAINDELVSQFYEWNQGSDWREVVDRNTKSLIALAQSQKPLFHKSMKELINPTLLIGSKSDDMTGDITQEYEKITRDAKDARMYIFAEGDHPTVLSRAQEVAQLVNDFLLNNNSI